jgi:hypothetical protein
MYHYQSFWIDGDVASRPDALLASGEAFGFGYQQQQDEEVQSQLKSSMASFRHVMNTGEEETKVMAPPARYSAEERRERIDKYRSKRNQRNFQKKITVRLSLSLLPFHACSIYLSI